MTDTAPLAALMGHIDRCLALHGQDGFAPAYLELLEALGADQVMVFSYGPDYAACLMSRNFREARLGKRLAADYLDGWFRLDPLYAAALAQAAGEVAVRSVTPRDESMTPDYRARFYDAPGLGGKLSVLAAGERLRLVVQPLSSRGGGLVRYRGGVAGSGAAGLAAFRAAGGGGGAGCADGAVGA